jgi:hypothetical protein
MPETPRVEVDFNDFEADGRLGALTSSADNPSALAPGVLVTLWDEDGNTAQGRVAELADRGLVWIDVLRETWRSGPEARSAEQVVAANLADLKSSGWVLCLTAGSTTSFTTNFGVVAPDFYLVQPIFHAVWGTMGPLAAVRGLAGWPQHPGWPQHLDFAEYYKLRLVTGVAPATAEVGS